jgi:hypothetical protein
MVKRKKREKRKGAVVEAERVIRLLGLVDR